MRTIYRTNNFITAIFLLASAIAGCSSDKNIGMPLNESGDDVPKVSEAYCHACHGTSINRISGQPIFAGYTRSKHFRNPGGDVTGCQGCHGGGAQHNGAGPIPYNNPDTAGKCFTCHERTFKVAHFYNITGSGSHPAMYVTTNYRKSCGSCHEPHNHLSAMNERKSWAISGHGSEIAPAWSHYDFKNIAWEGTFPCLRCHTSSGFRKYAAGNFSTPFPTTTWAGVGDSGREVLACNACHRNSSFRRLSSAAFTAPYPGNGSNMPATFPDVGESNLCIPCHSGRESGAAIASISDFRNVAFVDSHNMAAAGLMYMQIGFINFTSLDARAGISTYGKTLLPNKDMTQVLAIGPNAGKTRVIAGVPNGVEGGVASKHRQMGTPSILYAEDWIITSGIYDTRGPCVSCHIKAEVSRMPPPELGTNVGGVYNGNGPYYVGTVQAYRPDSHRLLAITDSAAQQACNPCHGDDAYVLVPGPKNGAVLKNENYALPGFKAGLAVTRKLLAKPAVGITYDATTYPYFFDDRLPPVNGLKQPVRDWTRGTGNQTFGRKLMGACYNLHVMTRDQGAYVHARNYAQRLLFDSVDFLDDGVMNSSSAATYIANDTTGYFPPGATPATLTWLFKAGGIRP
jgi:hypothetical protein